MKSLILTIFCFLLGFTLQAQERKDTLHYSLNARYNPGFGSYAPFLSTVNQYDRHSLTPNSLSAWANLYKPMATNKRFDYGFGVELNANVSPTEKRWFPGELYAEGKVFFMDVTVGMKREIFGNQDPELSSGGMIGSQNSRPIPSLTIETNGYVAVPFTKGYLEFMGGMANGYFSDSTVTSNTLLHHKWLYVRVGGSFPLNVHYGIQHVAQWAGSSPDYGTGAVTLENFMRVFLGRSGTALSPSEDRLNAMGNHIISKNLGLDLTLPNLTMTLYWQNIYEDGPVLRMNKAFNVEDGLWGLSIRLPRFRPLRAFAVEFLSTTDQSGPWHELDGVIYGGVDDYYNNYFYTNGWSFYGMTIGNPWLTSPKYNTDGSVKLENNKVRLWYFSGKGQLGDYRYRTTVALSKNFGCPNGTYPSSRNQFSGQMEVSRNLPFLKNLEVSLGASGDRGGMYGNNFSVLLGVRYSGTLFY
jgi:hypothetical protein